MEPFVHKDQSLLSIESWEERFPDLTAGMTTKLDGVSHEPYASLNMGFHVNDNANDVCANRERVAAKLKLPLQQWVGAEQIHNTSIKKVSKSDRGKGANNYSDSFQGTDGFYTNEEGILLTLCYADCVPLFFHAPEKKMIGAAHAGWKGTVAQIAKEMIQLWELEGIQAKDIHVAIGPSICEKCYIVDNHVVNLIENILEDVDRKPYNLISAGQYSLDLRLLNKQLLIKAGVPEKQIIVSNLCTSCEQELFFSYRRDQGKTGRMLSYIGWKEKSFVEEGSR
ncbi:peptidoglycan editing factor PgeF [Bacillus rubiinfantis]|uniref:peptidoglycan editing factor PgeF n=1 Tax=Bacillus rubiinfantis TaxID=1499680 RepID=UPI0005A8CC0E|nr:peptidoglycan editing factor PgeF [Bacillus rubiinfantis]